MGIIEEYSRQYSWRSWATVLDALPPLEGRLVLDLGCGIGDLAAALSERGARVTGVDLNEELVGHARGRGIANAQFRTGDLRSFHDPGLRADGIWSSFTAAYFPALRDTLGSWLEHLRPGGWLALTEMDDLFGHEPLPDRTRELLNRYVEDSAGQMRYDFRAGRKLAGILRQAGLEVFHEFTVPDAELAFSGPAPDPVLSAWQARFERMHLLREFCGPEFEQVRDGFLDCLKRDDHVCHATVRCCIARRPES